MTAILALVALAALAGCQASPAPALTPAAVTATQPAPTHAATSTAPAAAKTPEEDPGERAPRLADFAWEDRAPFTAGLIAEEQSRLAELPGATEYHIAITVADDMAAVTGHEAVRYTNREDVPLDEIVFHLYPNLLGGAVAADALTVDGQPVSAREDVKNTVLRVPLAGALAPGASAVVEMDFAVQVPTELERNYGVLADAKGVLALAHFYPMVAVYDSDGWDVEVPSEQGDVVYADASFYLVQVRAPARLVIAAAGEPIDQQRSSQAQVLTFALGPARDFYLAASEDYVVATRTAGATTISSYVPAALAGSAPQALDTTAEALAVYSERYGPYPYTGLDLVATPTLALGIEYPGIIALTQTMFDPAADFGGQPPSAILEATTAHEVAHQWFYNLVGNDQLDEPWLDEALAQYATLQYYAEAHGAAGARGFHQSLEARWARVNDADIPIGEPVSDYSGREYSAIVYGRGPLFFEALQQTMGAAAFDAFMTDYTTTYRWRLATGPDLKALAEEHCACDLTALFDEWVW